MSSTITIMDRKTNARTYTIEAVWQDPLFAIHLTPRGTGDVRGPDYCLTHLPTGYQILAGFATITEAMLAARRCHDLDIPWESTNQQVLIAHAYAIGLRPGHITGDIEL